MNNSHTIRNDRRKRERLARREAILEAAREVFFSKGLMAATVDEIAERCGLAKGTIYLYFQSKEEIYVSLMDEGTGLLRKEMERVEGFKNLRSDKLLERLLKVYYGFYKRYKDYFKIIFLSMHPDVQAKVSEGLIERSIENGKGCLRVVSKVIKRGIDSGLFRNMDSWAAANILWATVNGIIMIYEQDARHRKELVGMDLEEILKTSLDLVLKGLKR